MSGNENAPSTRAGHYVPQIGGHKAFIPNGLPPQPPVAMDDELLTLLSAAEVTGQKRNRAFAYKPYLDFFEDTEPR
jgi:hypothetical protein